MLERRDIFLGLLIGFVFGWLLIPIFSNIGVNLGGYAFFLPIAFALFAAGALFAAWILARWWAPLFQFSKFAAVGALNFSIDFGVLNVLILVTSIAAGLWFVVFKSISVAVAIVNSYLWNKFWTFSDRQTKGGVTEFAEFLVITLVGIGINVGVAHLVVNIIGPLSGIGLNLWANIGALASVAVTLFWNYFGYKYFVFKKPASTALQPPVVGA